MRITILLPHYKTSKMTAYTISQLLKLSGRHLVDIIIIDNNSGDGSLDSVAPFLDRIRILNYPKNLMQSHGLAFDYAMPHIHTEYFITIESDSFPTQPGWLDYYEDLIHQGYDSAGSLLSLSGGTYIHPAGALYRKSVYNECLAYCNSMPYVYFPHIAVKGNFACHLMVRKDLIEQFCDNPGRYITMDKKLENLSRDHLLQIAVEYSPVTKVFHNGMGNMQESYLTYGKRNMQTGLQDQQEAPRDSLIYRLGYEPGQFLAYWQHSRGKKIFQIPTHTIWMKGRENQQQDSTIMENGFRHLWAVTSYHGAPDDPERMDIINRKKEIVEKLYHSLPEKEKVL